MQSGETYGALTLKYKEGPYWICSCDCGNQKVTARASILLKASILNVQNVKDQVRIV